MSQTAASHGHEALIVWFDRVCAFCSLCIGRVRTFLLIFPEAISYQWADRDAVGLTGDDLSLSTVSRMQPSSGIRFVGHLLVGHLLVALPFSLGAMVAYRLVARYNYRLPRVTPACGLPRDGATT